MKIVRITLENCPQHVDAEKIRQAANFYAEILMSKLRRPIRVCIRWTYSRKVKVAESIIDDSDYRRLPSIFTVLMSAKRRGWQIYQSLAHEMVHIRQWASGVLRCRKTDHDVKWNGIIYKWDQETLAYWDSPWELEAMSLEPGLYQKFKAAFDYKGSDLAAVT